MRNSPHLTQGIAFIWLYKMKGNISRYLYVAIKDKDWVVNTTSIEWATLTEARYIYVIVHKKRFIDVISNVWKL